MSKYSFKEWFLDEVNKIKSLCNFYRQFIQHCNHMSKFASIVHDIVSHLFELIVLNERWPLLFDNDDIKPSPS
jgi:CII-binding regulator of phage lambda lysogenization HflD